MKKQAIWPGWETTRLIGRGSFGAVYEIERRLFEDDEPEKAALKVITIPQNDSDIEELYNDGYDEESVTSTFHSHLKSIVAEYSLMRKMNGSSNIVNCDDVRYVQHDDGIGWDIYIKMELLTPLTKALPATVSEEQVIKIAKDMCAALELCQKHNIIHRDIKPQNIFISENGDYKLGDFGIAKTVEKTMGGTKTGTYKYMAPEVYSNRPYNSTADIYSLGLVLYWLLNERRMPFMPLPPEKLRAGMDEESRSRRFSGEKILAPKNGSNALKQIVLKACAFDPKDRYQSAREIREDLQRLSGGQTAEFIPESEPAPILDISDDTGDNKTMGPIFKHTPAVDTDDLDKTVGPVFDHNVADDLDKSNTIKSNTQNKEQKGNKTFGVVAALLAVGVLCSFLFFGKDTDKDTEPISVEQTTLGKEEHNTVPLIDSPIDISGSFAQGSHFVSYDPVFYYGFQVIVDQNHRMYLINEGTDNPGSNIVYDTGISNVASVYVGYEYDPSYECNMPKLYYLTTAKEIWTAKMIPGEKWEIQRSERYGEWADVRQIYIGSSILSGLVILKDNGDLYVGSQKIPILNVVDVQCFFDSIMFRTDDGTFYVAGENSYGSFVETSSDFIPFEQPERLLIPTDADDACVVRAIINGQQNYRVAILEGGILSIQDKPGNYLVEGFGNVRAIEVADMALYIIHEDGTLYGFGTFSSGGQLTSAGLAEDGICRITEFDGMNKIMGLAFHGWGCMAVDSDGTIRINTEGYSGPLYKENGEQFCFANSKQNDSEENLLIWGLDMTLEDFERRSEQLLETASTWTMETAPQTLDDFPLFPSSVFALFDTIKSAEEEMTVSDSMLIWNSELPKILPETNTGMKYSHTFDYVDGNKNSWIHMPVEATGNCEYIVQLPENVWGPNNRNFKLSIDGHNYFDGWNEVLQVSYPISSKQIDGASFIGLIMSNSQYSVAWYCYAQESKIKVDIYSYSNGRIWNMTYDAASGRLVNMTK